MDNTEKQTAVELAGHSFRRVKSGLDEAEVSAFVQKLVSEREEMEKRQTHFASLMKLAEKTIANADEIAEQTLKDAHLKAESEAREVAAKAEDEARAQIESVTAEALARASQEADVIRASALEQANGSLKAEAERLRAQLREMSGMICQRMAAQAENFAREISAVQGEFGLQVDRINSEGVVLEPDFAAPSKPGEPARAQTTSTPSPMIAAASAASPDKRLVEVEIPPPRDAAEIARIETFLKSLPEVEAEELVNYVDRTTIIVLLSKEVDLAEKLAEQPMVEKVFETDEGGKHKVHVRLSLKSSLDNAKDALSSSIGRILEKRR